ncbi:MAG TPA: helix-turn-helix domain-containing protein [Gammaproteobacteria bacterium]|nr:helix-turn-helix domain-containing protein [Gammaproteobacteria bacterium]
MDEILVKDRSGDRKYFTQIPHLIDDAMLSPYAVRVYLRIKRRAGESGECFESVRSLADACCMSKSQAARAITELKGAGMIDVTKRKAKHGHFAGNTITIRDIWPQNIQKYASQNNDVSLVGTRPVPEDAHGPVPGVGQKKNPLEEEGGKTTPSSRNGRDERLGHPALKTFRDQMGFHIHQSFRDEVIRVVGREPDALRAWERVLREWTGRGYNPRNISGILDAFARGGPRGSSNGRDDPVEKLLPLFREER